MKKIGFNKYECLTRLRLYRDMMEQILLLVEGNLPLRSTDEKKSQSILKELQKRLHSDLKRSSIGAGQKQIGNIEQKFYLPAIFEASKRISVDPNSTPDQRWIDEIDIAQKHIKYCLNQLLSS